MTHILGWQIHGWCLTGIDKSENYFTKYQKKKKKKEKKEEKEKEKRTIRSTISLTSS